MRHPACCQALLLCQQESGGLSNQTTGALIQADLASDHADGPADHAYNASPENNLTGKQADGPLDQASGVSDHADGPADQADKEVPQTDSTGSQADGATDQAYSTFRVFPGGNRSVRFKDNPVPSPGMSLAPRADGNAQSETQKYVSSAYAIEADDRSDAKPEPGQKASLMDNSSHATSDAKLNAGPVSYVELDSDSDDDSHAIQDAGCVSSPVDIESDSDSDDESDDDTDPEAGAGCVSFPVDIESDSD